MDLDTLEELAAAVRETVGTVLGAVAGGLLGSKAGDGTGWDVVSATGRKALDEPGNG